MSNPSDPLPREKARLRRTGRNYRARWITVAAIPFALAVLIMVLTLPSDWDTIAKAGLVQPAVAALIALAIVLSMRLTWGRYSNDRRKGVISASSATIAVKLWALCFALLFGSMMLGSVVNKWTGTPSGKSEAPPKAVETQLEVSTNGSAPAVAKAKVIR
ncbi:hypothetical protein [Sphingomonas sp. Ag1]|jgi:hypothetical protein|uniref:hypothetical protein n=1 Tax=Sphingomonas sp. Ag1 TaxID=1642949 RepID=UPI0012E00D7B|nr:hypothetical protein [Sphingomonas sp. Ag1]